MLLLLSPAKKLDYDSPVRTELSSQPLFVEQAQPLIDILRTQSEDDIAGLMKLSPDLARLNVQRYQEWEPVFDRSNSRQAVLAFNGDVYEGMAAQDLSDKDLKWAQDHLVLLSGLYGALRPLDLMRPYRLEMGTRLKNPAGNTLYAYWGSRIADYLNQRQEGERDPVVLNLASEEYFKVVDQKVLRARVVQCVFQDEKNGAWKVISFYAKKARGLMARYVIDHRIQKVEDLKAFDSEGYAFQPDLSTEDKLVFRRPEQA
ncbi:peroxide stress protein YaaA [Alcaligenes sp. Marseille-Q7550]